MAVVQHEPCGFDFTCQVAAERAASSSDRHRMVI